MIVPFDVKQDSDSVEGNRKRAHLAALESKLKSTVDNSNRDGFTVHQIDNESQLPEDFISNLDFGHMNFQSVAGDGAEPALSQPLFSDLSSEPALSLPESNFPIYLNPSFSVPSADINFGLGFPQVQPSSEREISPNGHENLTRLPVNMENPVESNSSSHPNTHFIDIQPRPETPSITFSDEAYISVPGLSLIRAHGTIIQRIQRNGCNIDLWDPFSISPFYQPNNDSPMPPLDTLLTDNYRPTALQKLVKHHPIFDLLPWPSARNKMLQVMSLPVNVRPQRAQDEMQNVVLNLFWDMKDAGGGLRVWGQDPFNENNWEVGQRFFELWWWALDNDIIRNSNNLRKDRGEDVLCLKKIQ